jgi:hypothetical protein
MKTMNRIKIQWLIALLMALALFRPSSGFAWEYTNNFSWLELIPPGYWLDSWSFEDTNWDSDFGFAPLSYSNIVQEPDWDGNALQVDTTNAAWLTYGITQNAPGYGEYTNLMLDTGSIEFMFVPNWQSDDTNFYGSGPEDFGRFIDVGAWTTNADSDWWSLYLNPSGTAIYFSSGTNGIRTNYLNAPISWDGSTWHQIVLTFGPTNSFLYLDGQLAASGAGICYVPSGDALTNGFAVGSDFATGLQQAHGQFDDLYTYNYQLNSNDVASDYADISPELPGGFHAMDDSPPFPGEGGGGGGGASPGDDFSYSPNYGTNLWIQQFGISSNYFTGILSNTIADVEYQLLYVNSLNPPVQWAPVPNGVVSGSETTNWTLWSTLYNPTTNFFLTALSYQDDSGTGIPDWWWLKYFGQDTNVNAFANSLGDGWTLLQDYENGWIPTNWVTPPAPQGLAVVSYNSVSNWATVTWLPSSGAVTNYTLQTPSGNVNISPSSDSYVDQSSSLSATYMVQANYAGGNSAWSAEANVPANQNTLSANIIGGPIGSAYLAVSDMPTNTASLQLSLIDFFGVITNLTIPVGNPTNGFYSIPNFELPVQNYDQFWTATAEDTNGNPISTSIAAGAGYFPQENYYATAWVVPPYFDGRTAMKQNLIFLLRAANENSPIEFDYALPWEEPYQSVYSYPTNYVCEGFYDILYPYDFDVFEPFEENYLYLNFAFNPNNVDSSGEITSGPTGNSFPIGMNEPTTYQFTYPTANDTSIPAVLSTSDTQWLCSYPPDANDYSEMGIDQWFDDQYNLYFSMTNDVPNYFGLPFTSTAIAWGSGSGNYTVLNAGGTVENVNGYFYPATVLPKFQTLEYDFWQNPGAGSWPYAESAYTTNVPGTSGFLTSYTNSLMIASVGDPRFQVVCYSKMEVTNSIYSGVYAYLGQYFTNAYQIDSSGNVTTNIAGMLSPYGQFFATVPGQAALLTMPDIDTGQQGTGIVNCISLQVDKNHDGVMDTNFFGADATSEASPMEFWVNNGCDVYNTSIGGGLDEDLEVPPATTNYTLGQITCPRDLENFARLWLCGMPALPTNDSYQVTLSWNVVSGNPAINLYNSVETNGGIGYITDTNIAAAQCISTAHASEPYGGVSFSGPSTAIASITPSSSYTFPATNFISGGNQYFLFEGAGIGEGELKMTVYQNSNAVAQTGVWLDLHDIKDYYESVVITNNLPEAISNMTSSVQIQRQATSSLLGNDTNIIVMVHGINVGDWNWLDDSETVLHRLYWAGYNGKFMTVKWPCNYFNFDTLLGVDTTVFNDSEFKAYKASQSLVSYSTQLRSRFPGYQLNLYAHSQGNAVVAEAIAHGASFDTYILTEGALPDSAYDVNAPTNATLAAAESSYGPTPISQPMGYAGIYTNFTGRIYNFYNTNDPVLATWEYDQRLAKPNTLATPYSYDGTHGWYQIEAPDSYIVTDPEESRSEVSRSLTLSIGQSPPETAHGVIESGIDMKAHYGFNNAFPADHSAQWTWPIQTTLPYYQQLLTEILPAP